jgi:SAM-dependent methyltransferase
VDAAYARGYEQLFHEHWWSRARVVYIERELRRFCPARGFGAILDVGCGNGLLFPVLRRYGEPEGVEPDASLLTESGREHGRIHLTPFDRRFRPGHRYGLILMLDVLEHLPDAEAALSYAAELLAPGGRILVTVPAFRALWTSHDAINHHHVRYSRKSLRRIATAAGLQLSRSAYLFGWLVPVKLAVRLAEAALGPQATTLHRTPPQVINQLLYGVSRAEQAFCGRLLPAGSSLLAWLLPTAPETGSAGS